MHEGTVIKDILNLVEKLKLDNANKVVKAITVELSEFGGIGEEHFRFHFEREVKDSNFKDVELFIKKIPFGQDIRLVSVTFGGNK